MTCPPRVKWNGGTARLRAGFMAGAVVLALPIGHARAADWLDDTLRGTFNPGPAVRWDGVNLGVQGGVSSMDIDFGNSTGQQVAHILRNSTLESEASPSTWAALPHNITNSKNYGAFLGYNYQWDALVLGFDAAYNKLPGASTQASDGMTRVVTTSDSVQHTVTLAASSSITLLDYATMRMRAGYALGQFLGYAFVGGAVGRFNYSTTSTVTDSQLDGGVTTVFGPVTDRRQEQRHRRRLYRRPRRGRCLAAERVLARRMGICRLRPGQRHPSQHQYRPRRHRYAFLAHRLSRNADHPVTHKAIVDPNRRFDYPRQWDTSPQREACYLEG